MRKTSSSTVRFVWLAPLLGVAYLLSARASRAWTSVDGPLTDAIHQMAIDKVLASLSSSDRDILKDQQSLVDQDQEPKESAEHAMTGIDKEGLNEASQKIVYIGLTEDLVEAAIRSAIQARKDNNVGRGLPILGKAIHALEDSTSPSHRGFQSWSYSFGLIAKTRHVIAERIYPNDNTVDRYQSHLEGVVEYAYDIYLEKTPMPARFFDPTTGMLLLPASYLHTH
jgi:hypothetical protein